MMENCVPVFRHPATVIVTGPSSCGKSTFVKKVILNSKELVKSNSETGFDCVIVLYRVWNELYEELKRDFTSSSLFFYKDSIEDSLEELISGFKTPVLWIDDGVSEKNMTFVEDVFTRYSHHLNLSCFLVTHNLYAQKGGATCMRTISRNANYVVLMNYPRDKGIGRVLVQQCQPTRSKAKALMDTVEKTVSGEPYGYLLLDFSQRTPEALRYKSNIFCEKSPHYPMVHTFRTEVI